jgi:hypothetical protein
MITVGALLKFIDANMFPIFDELNFINSLFFSLIFLLISMVFSSTKTTSRARFLLLVFIFYEQISGRILCNYFTEYSTALLFVRMNRIIITSLSGFVLFYYHNSYLDHAYEMHKKITRIEQQNSFLINKINNVSKFNNQRSSLRKLKTDGK